MNEYLGKYKKQIRDADGRGIDWKLTFSEWYDIWDKSGHILERGRKKGQYCMSRYGDVGPYAVGNVFIQLHSQNIKDAAIGNQVNLGRKHSVESKEKMTATRTGLKRGPYKTPPWNKGLKLNKLGKK